MPAGGRLDQTTLISTRANLQPAVAAYVRDADSSGSSAYGIMVLTVDGDHIIEITGFADPAPKTQPQPTQLNTPPTAGLSLLKNQEQHRCAAPLAALPAPRSASGARSRGRAARTRKQPRRTITLIGHARTVAARTRLLSLPIVQVAAAASMAALAGRRMRSAAPTNDPAGTPMDLGTCENDEEA